MTHIRTRGMIIFINIVVLMNTATSQKIQNASRVLSRLDTSYLFKNQLSNSKKCSNLKNDSINYLANIYAELGEINKDTNSFITHAEILATYLSYIGDYETANTLTDSVYYLNYKDVILKRKAPNHAFLDSLQLISPNDTILKYAAEARVIMFSEAHHKPQHRIITQSYLKQLKAIGYNAIAFEGLSSNPIKNELYNFTNGFYLAEPYYANLVNYAKQLGFKIIIYDTATSNAREQSACNVLSNYLEKNPLSKLIVHVGYGHNIKFKFPNKTMLGGLLQEKYKVLAISQTQVTNGYSTTSEIIYNYLSQKNTITIPWFLYKNNQPYKIKYNDVDFIMISPKIKDIDSGFLKKYCEMDRKKINLFQTEVNNGLYGQIFSAKNNLGNSLTKTVPLKNFVIEPLQFNYDIIVPKAKRYWLIIRNNRNEIISKRIFK